MRKKKEVARNVVIAVGVANDNEKYCDNACRWLDESSGYCQLFDEHLTAEELHEICESCGHTRDTDACFRCKDCIDSEVELQE